MAVETVMSKHNLNILKISMVTFWNINQDNNLTSYTIGKLFLIGINTNLTEVNS